MGKRKRSKQDSSGAGDDIEEADRTDKSHEDNVTSFTTPKKKNKKDKSKNIVEDTSAEQGNIATELQQDSKSKKVKKKSIKLNSSLNEEENQTEESTDPLIPIKAKKVKKKHVTEVSDINTTEESIKKKEKKIKPVTESSTEIDKKTGSVKKNKQSSSSSNSRTSTSVVKNKKIIFDDDDKPQAEVSFKKKADKSKSFLNEEEADVKDEDIDKFCDELGDDDNVQYENWVQLIEAKLHSNSKKAK